MVKPIERSPVRAALCQCCWILCLAIASLSSQISVHASPVKSSYKARHWRDAQSSLVDQVQRYQQHDGSPAMRWRTYWKVKWRPAHGAAYYQVRLRTNEGVSKAMPEKTVTASYQLEVAKGDNPEHQGLLAREVQLLTISNLLSIQIVPVLKNGRQGLASPWMAVGEVDVRRVAGSSD